jgi:transcriptional regulator with XRE-family HTH domain
MMTTEEFQRRVSARRTLPLPAERRAMRVATGITTAELADLVGVSRQAIQHWESGTRTPGPKHLLAYAAALKTMLGAR